MTLLKSGWLATGVGEGDGAGVGDGTGVGVGVATGVGLGVAIGVGIGEGATMGLEDDAGVTMRFCSTAEAFAGLATKPMATDWPGARALFHDLGVTL
jgi:hypothetical protein